MQWNPANGRAADRAGGAITAEYLTAHPQSFDARLRDGRRVRVRPIVAGDREAIARGLSRMSPETRYRRFHRAVDRLSERELEYLANVDQERHVAWGVITLEEPGRPGIAAARFVRDADDPEQAEFAIAIVDAYQGAGLGRILMETLLLSAADAGIRRLIGYVLPDNRRALTLFRSLGGPPPRFVDGTFQIEIPVETPCRTLRTSGQVRLGRLRSAAGGVP